MTVPLHRTARPRRLAVAATTLAVLAAPAALRAQQGAPPITSEQVTSLLGAGVSATRIESLLRERGCGAPVDPAFETELERLKAPATLREALRKSCGVRSAAPPLEPPRPVGTTIRVRDFSVSSVYRTPADSAASACRFSVRGAIYVLDASAQATRACVHSFGLAMPVNARIEATYALTPETHGANPSRLDFASEEGNGMSLTCGASGTCALQSIAAGGSWRAVTPWTAVPSLQGGAVREIHAVLLLRGERVDVFVNGDWVHTYLADRPLRGRVGIGANARTTAEFRLLTAEPLAEAEATLAAPDLSTFRAESGPGCSATGVTSGLPLTVTGSAPRCSWRIPLARGATELPSRFQLWYEGIPEVTARSDDAFAIDYASGPSGDLSLVYDLGGGISIQRNLATDQRWSTLASAPAGTLTVSRGAPLRLRLVQDGSTVTVWQGTKRVLTGTATPPSGAWPELAVNAGTQHRISLLRIEPLR